MLKISQFFFNLMKFLWLFKQSYIIVLLERSLLTNILRIFLNQVLLISQNCVCLELTKCNPFHCREAGRVAGAAETSAARSGDSGDARGPVCSGHSPHDIPAAGDVGAAVAN